MPTLFVFIFVVVLGCGWVVNVVKLVDCDFKPDYKCEIMRGVGVFVVPLTLVTAWMDIGEENEI